MDELANGRPWLLLFCSEMLPSLFVAGHGRHKRKEERKDSRAGEKCGVLLLLAGSKADGQSQMDALGWQVSHNSYCSGFWLLSPVNCVAWSALSRSLLSMDFSQSGQLAVDGSCYLSLLAAAQSVSRWLKS